MFWPRNTCIRADVKAGHIFIRQFGTLSWHGPRARPRPRPAVSTTQSPGFLTVAPNRFIRSTRPNRLCPAHLLPPAPNAAPSAQLDDAVDYWSVMTYDYSTTHGAPGGNAPLGWLKANMLVLAKGEGGWVGGWAGKWSDGWVNERVRVSLRASALGWVGALEGAGGIRGDFRHLACVSARQAGWLPSTVVPM